MNSITLLQSQIDTKLAALQDNDHPGRIEVMALIDERFNYGETAEEYNIRLRNSVKSNFNKILLRDEQTQLFREWEAKLELLGNSTRAEIFSAAPEAALSIVGL